MNITTWRREGPADLCLAIPGLEGRSAGQEARRSGKSMLSGIALSAALHAGILVAVLFAAANPWIGFPTAGNDGVVRVSLVTVTACPENGGGAARPAAVKKVWSAPPKADEKTAIPQAEGNRPAERQPAETSISAEPDRGSYTTAPTGRVASPGEAVRGQRQSGAVSQEGSTEAMPRYRDNRPPFYPGAARQRGYEGDVLISAEVRSDGRIGAIRVKRSSGYASLDDAALDAVRVWRFEPARRMGAAVDAWVEIPIRFKLSAGDSLM